MSLENKRARAHKINILKSQDMFIYPKHPRFESIEQLPLKLSGTKTPKQIKGLN